MILLASDCIVMTRRTARKKTSQRLSLASVGGRSPTRRANGWVVVVLGALVLINLYVFVWNKDTSVSAIADAAPMPEDLRMRRREPGALERLAATLPATPQLILPLAVDRLQWDADTAAFFDQPGFVVVDKRVLIAGTATPNALQGLTRRGWEIVEGAQVAVD